MDLLAWPRSAKAGPGDGRRDGGDAGHLGKGGRRSPIGRWSAGVGRGLDHGGEALVVDGAAVGFFERADHHVGLAAEHPVDDLGLKLGDELGQEDDHRHAAGGAGENQQGRHAPFAQSAGHEGERQADLHRRGRGVWPITC